MEAVEIAADLKIVLCFNINFLSDFSFYQINKMKSEWQYKVCRSVSGLVSPNLLKDIRLILALEIDSSLSLTD